jgi:1-pyrroline-5-carboxylate dehydrogenase
VGNLYINRKCTGALVGVHPFGGFNMSGTDSKAGGPDYLLLFLQAKSISEKPI